MSSKPFASCTGASKKEKKPPVGRNSLLGGVLGKRKEKKKQRHLAKARPVEIYGDSNMARKKKGSGKRWRAKRTLRPISEGRRGRVPG